MDLPLNNVLNLTKEEIENSKIEFNMQAGSGGQPFLDRWLKHSDDEKMSGTCTDCSYWGWYGKQRNFYPGQWVFSFARMTDDEWLLISAAEIVDVPADEWATVNVLERFVPLFGRLIIKCKKSYYYLTDDDSIEVGDFVLVPAGKDNHEAVVEVVNIEYFSEENVPLPIEKTKRIIRKCTDEDFDPPVE